MSTELQPVALGFDEVVEDVEAAEYDVQFTPTAGGDDTPKAGNAEEVGLLEEGSAKDSSSPVNVEKVCY
jgi:hypothetical protein